MSANYSFTIERAAVLSLINCSSQDLAKFCIFKLKFQYAKTSACCIIAYEDHELE